MVQSLILIANIIYKCQYKNVKTWVVKSEQVNIVMTT